MSNFVDKTVLVTGGAGFIGSHLVNRLVETGYNVHVLDDLSTGLHENLCLVKNDIHFIKGDLRDINIVEHSLKKIDVVFHLGANASVPHSVNDPKYDFDTNVIGTFNIMEASRKNDVKKIIFASSAAVYGKPIHKPMNEEHPTNPVSPYGASKLYGEKIGFVYNSVYGLNFSAIRIFNAYGPHQRRYVMYDFIKKLYENPKILKVLGSGNQKRQFCYIDDVIDGIMLFTSKRKKDEGVYNLAGKNIVTIKNIANMIVSILSPGAKIIYGEKNWRGDIKELIGDTSKINSLGFNPKIGLLEGIKNFIGWYKYENING